MQTTTLSRKTIQLPKGEALSYYDTNPAGSNSKTLVLLHGAYLSSDIYLDHISKFPADFRVIAIDFRGHGNSSFNTPISSLDDLAEDLKEMLDLLQIKTISLFGWSTGGGVSLLFAAKYPSYVEKVVLYASIGAKGAPMYQFDEKGKMTKNRLKSLEEMFNYPPVLMGKNIQKEKDRDTAKLFLMASLFNARGKASPQLEERLIDSFLKCKCNGYLEYALNSFNISSESNEVTQGKGEIFSIKCPVLILHGQKDKVIPVSEAKATKDLLKDQATLHIFNEGGHAILEDYPEEIYSLVKEFLSDKYILKSSKL